MISSLTINDRELEELKKYLLKVGLKREKCKSEYELLRIKDGKISIVVYKSGKVVHNESTETLEVLDNILKKEKNFDYILGSDETGKGEWYGPLVVEAVALTPDEIHEFRKLGVRDSKTISKIHLKELAKDLIKKDFKRNCRILKPETYNRKYSEFQKEGKSLNMILAWAHAAVVKELLSQVKFEKAKVIIDKFDYEKTEFRLGNLDRTNIEIIQKSKGESEIPVATASIIAKYIFENEVDKLDEEYSIDLRNSEPSEIDPEILPHVAKIHFKNVKKYI